MIKSYEGMTQQEALRKLAEKIAQKEMQLAYLADNKTGGYETREQYVQALEDELKALKKAYAYFDNVDAGKLFASVLDDDQLGQKAEWNGEILDFLSDDQRKRIENGENIFTIIDELSPEAQARIYELSQELLASLNDGQKADLLFLSSPLLGGIDLNTRQTILQRIKDNGGELTYEDLVALGVYEEGDREQHGSKYDIGGPYNFAALLKGEYRLNQYGTSLYDMDVESKKRQIEQMTLLLAVAAAPLADYMLYGPYGVEYGDNPFDSIEKQDTTGWKPGEIKDKVKLPANDSQIKHIFRDAAGHLSDTPENRTLLENTANDPRNDIGSDIHGTKWFAKTLPDGRQVWVRAYNGIIINGGINANPRTFDTKTGLNNNPLK